MCACPQACTNPLSGLPPACLPALLAATQALQANQVVRVIGWGSTAEASYQPASTLQQVDVPYVDQATCSALYPGLLTSSMICAGEGSGFQG